MRSGSRSDTAPHADTHGGGRLHAEVAERERGEIGRARGRGKRQAVVETGSEDRNGRVTGVQRAVAAAARMMTAAEILELPPARRGDDHFARVGATQGGPNAFEAVGVL